MSQSAVSKRFVPVEKSRAAPSRFQIVRITPLGGTTGVPNQKIRIQFPSNRIGSYLDAENSFISMGFKCPQDVLSLGYGGLGGFFSDVVLRNGGQNLSSLNRNDIFRNYTAKTQIPREYIERDGWIMSGMGTRASTDPIFTGGTVHTLVDPLSNYAPLFRTGSYVPLFTADHLELELTFGTLIQNLDWNHEDTAPSSLEFSEITLHLAIIEVAPEVDKQIISANNGVFKYLTNNVSYFNYSIASSMSSAIFQLGASFSSCNKIDIMMTNVTKAQKDALDQHFIRHNLKRVSLLVDGSQVLVPYISAESPSIALAMARIAQHGLSDYSTSQRHPWTELYVDDSFIISFDTETTLQKSGELRSGLNLSSSISQISMEFAAAIGADVRVHIFVYYDSLASMDLSGTRNFEQSI